MKQSREQALRVSTGLAATGLGAALLGPMLLCGGSAALAAGGHHAVDDAATVDPGQCQLEAWFDRSRQRGADSPGDRSASLLHLGPACRVGPVELSFSGDRVRAGAAGASTLLSGQLKWASALTQQFSVGLVTAANWGGPEGRSRRYLGSNLVVPVSWQPSPEWAAHLNLGRDFVAAAADSSRAGLALEWAPQDAWSLVAERYREGGVNSWRLGGRWNLTPALSLDLSRAADLGADPSSRWTLGLNVVLNR